MVFAGRWSVKHGTEGSGCVAKGSGPRVVNDIKQEEVGRGGAVQGTRLGWRKKDTESLEETTRVGGWAIEAK